MSRKTSREPSENAVRSPMVLALVACVVALAGVLYFSNPPAEPRSVASQDASPRLAGLTHEAIKARLKAEGWVVQRDTSRSRFLHLHLEREGVRGTLIFAQYQTPEVAAEQVTANQEVDWASLLDDELLLSVQVPANPEEARRLIRVVTGEQSAKSTP